MLVTFSSRLLTFPLPTGDMIQYNSCLLINDSLKGWAVEQCAKLMQSEL